MTVLAITINIDPVLLQLGPIALRWYGLMYVVGILAGLYVALPYARRRGLDEVKIWTVFWWGAIGGLVGARLYYVVQSDLGLHLAQPWRILAVWEGGMAFYGAIVGAVFALALASHQVRLPFWPLADTGAIFAAIGQGFGRIGNIVNGDIIGYPTDQPWGVVYPHPRSWVPDHSVAYEPAAFYELFFNILLFAILWSLRFRFRQPGLLFASYLIVYSVGQFVLFFWRDNEVVLLGLKNAQLTAVVMLVVGLALAWMLRVRSKDSIAPAAQHERERSPGVN